MALGGKKRKRDRVREKERKSRHVRVVLTIMDEKRPVLVENRIKSTGYTNRKDAAPVIPLRIA